MVIHKSTNDFPLEPNTAKPNSEYDVIWSPNEFLTAIYSLIVYILSTPQNNIPAAPPTSPTSLIAEGVAKIPIPIKHLNILKYVYNTLVFPVAAESSPCSYCYNVYSYLFS